MIYKNIAYDTIGNYDYIYMCMYVEKVWAVSKYFQDKNKSNFTLIHTNLHCYCYTIQAKP